jgi:hypothetical protein
MWIIIILLLLAAYYIYIQPAGFQNNSYYFQGNENDSMYNGRQILPKLTHRLSNY